MSFLRDTNGPSVVWLARLTDWPSLTKKFFKSYKSAGGNNNNISVSNESWSNQNELGHFACLGTSLR
jgi:hypothetical protein